MMGISPELWEHLENTRSNGDLLTARPAATGLGREFLCAVDSQNQRHLLIGLQGNDAELRDAESRGLTVRTRELTVQGVETARYLDIACQDPLGNPILDLIGRELSGSLDGASCRPAEVVKRVLAKWRRFWSLVPKSILSYNELIGLFGELWFLRVWLASHVGLEEAIRRWRGPTGSRYDFEWVGESVEAKATSSTRGVIHRINGIDQMEPPAGGLLFLFSIRLREEAGSTNTLPGLVRMIAEDPTITPEVVDRFEATLLQSGYSHVHAEIYDRQHFRVVEEGLYAVRDNFPRIVTSTFVGGMPPGVEGIDYEINLGGFDQLRVARYPDEAVSLF